MNNASAQQKIFPLVPEHAASDMSAVLHMIPAEKAGALPPLGVTLPDDVAASFRGTPFADLYEEALNLLRSRNITAMSFAIFRVRSRSCSPSGRQAKPQR